MTDYIKPALRIIDAHTHIFPAKIAVKATNAIGAFYDYPMEGLGESEALLASGRKIGVDRYLVCSSATTPAQTAAINTFIAAQCDLHPEFYGFGALHPSVSEKELSDEADRIVSLGLHGVKLHPDFQKFNIDDSDALTLYRICAERHLPVLFHVGDARYDYSSPERLARALDAVPGLIAIAAHFGGYHRWEEAPRYLARDRVYFDTSSALFELSPERARELIDRFGYKRFFFGTDHPMWDHEGELKRFMALDLPEEIRSAILYRNFERVFAL